MTAVINSLSRTTLPVPMDIIEPSSQDDFHRGGDFYSVSIPDLKKETADKTFVKDMFNYFGIGEVTSVQYIENGSGDCEGRVHFKPFGSQLMNEIMNCHHPSSGPASPYVINIDGFTDHYKYWQLFPLLIDSIKPPHQDKSDYELELENKLAELRRAVDIIPEIVSTLDSLNARIKYLEDPEWLDDISAPLSMEDLSFSTDNMDVEDLKTPSKNHNIYSITQDDLSDVEEDMDVDYDELADIWPLPFNPS